MLFVLVSFLSLGGFQLGEADLMSCAALISETGFKNLYFFNSQEISEACPRILEYLECYDKEIEEMPEDLDDDNLLFHENIGNLVQDMCTNGSKLQNDYLSSRDCFWNVKDKFDSCLENAKSVFRKYAISNNADTENIETLTYEKECFTYGHAVGCMANEILNNCGLLQQATYIQLVQRSRYLGKFCQPSTAEALRTIYLEYLNLDEALKNMYEEAVAYEV